jgi:hypothetical protein
VSELREKRSRRTRIGQTGKTSWAPGGTGRRTPNITPVMSPKAEGGSLTNTAVPDWTSDAGRTHNPMRVGPAEMSHDVEGRAAAGRRNL